MMMERLKNACQYVVKLLVLSETARLGRSICKRRLGERGGKSWTKWTKRWQVEEHTIADKAAVMVAC